MRTLAKRLMTALLLLAFAGAPSLARAATINAASSTPAGAPGTPGERPSGAPSSAAPSEAAGYAAREAAAPEVGNFKGGDAGIYIGGGTLVLVLLIVLIILVL